MERIQTIIIGGGQAGLSVGYHLKKRGQSFLILDASERIGDAWRKRWDSLRLFTPARYAGLTGARFPGRRNAFPTKDEMADYLEGYATRFAIPVQTGITVDGLSRQDDHFVVTAGARRFEADQVVVAMANYQIPRVPRFAAELRPGIVQLHSSEYRNPAQLEKGGVLVVGVGNSGADIGVEVAPTHRTWLSGKENGQVPFRIGSLGARLLFMRLLRFVGHQVLTVSTPIGRKLRPTMLHRSAPLVRVQAEDLAAAGVERVGRVTGVCDGLPVVDGDMLDVTNVIWCTGFEHGFPWIRLPVFDDGGEPMHERGIATREPGLFFVGLHFLYSMSSATVIGVSRDAERVAKAIAARTRAARAA